MATVQPQYPAAPGQAVLTAPIAPATVRLSDAQTGNGDSTNVYDRGVVQDCNVLVKIAFTAGTTPTVTVAIKTSYDGTTWYDAGCVDGAIPANPATTPTYAAITGNPFTTTQTIYRLVCGISAYPWRYLKLVYSANTNMTITVDVITL